jgi:hypothetical protein
MAATYQARGTATGRALDFTATSALSSTNGARGSSAVVVLLTDGPTQETAEVLAAGAQNLQAVATVFAIGVRPDHSLAELQVAASTAAYQTVFEIDSYESLQDEQFVADMALRLKCAA